MDQADMVHKANQIAQFFESYPEAEAVAGIEDHLRKFWEPRMRRQIAAYAAEGGTGLRPLVTAAVQRMNERRPA